MGSSHPLAALAVARALVGGADREQRPEGRSETHRATGVFIAEHYSPDLDERRIEALTHRLRAAVEDSAGRVQFLGSAGFPGDDSLLSIFAASSLETVARLVERAEVAADRIVPALWRPGDG